KTGGLACVGGSLMSVSVAGGAASEPPGAVTGEIAPDEVIFTAACSCPARSATSRAEVGRFPGFLAVSAATSALISAGTVAGKAGNGHRRGGSATPNAGPRDGGGPRGAPRPR